MQWGLEYQSSIFLLRPPTKSRYCDVTMHALYFLSREKGETSRQECLTCDEKSRVCASIFYVSVRISVMFNRSCSLV